LEPLREAFVYTRITSESWENRRCKHRFCKTCLRSYVASKITDGVWNIRCPGERCPYLLVEADLRKLLIPVALGGVPAAASSGVVLTADQTLEREEGQALMQRYMDLRSSHYGTHLRAVLHLQASESQDAGLEPRAGAGEEDEADATTAATTATALAADDDGFQTWAWSECQACPRCLVIIRKETGCDRVECRCGTAFCYGCGAPAEGTGESCCCRYPVKDGDGRPGATLPRLARWLQVKGKLLPAS
jgi:E3 ubiquitin-protein ligase RNF144